MQKPLNRISKRDFIRRSLVAISAGVICYPCERILTAESIEQSNIYRSLAMYQEESAAIVQNQLKESGVSPFYQMKNH